MRTPSLPLALALIMALTACGYKTPLALPKPKPGTVAPQPSPPVTAPAPTPDSAKPDSK